MLDPLALGRCVVVAPGARAPEPWSDCERVLVERVDADTADQLCDAWRARRPLVLELTAGIGLDDPEMPPPEAVRGRQPWEWTVELDLPGERAHHGLWANALDARIDGQPPRSPWRDVALRLGALPSPHDDADVVLADGRPALLDGGPLCASLTAASGAAVLHRISLEHDSLQPLGDNVTDAVLAPDQLAAVTEPGAGGRVIAPAGAGKTRVLTERARLVLGSWGIPPAAVTLVTYNVRAAREMTERLVGVRGVRVRTLNALGLRLCGRARTLMEPEVRELLGELVAFPRRAETDPAAPWLAALSRLRLGLEDPETVEREVCDVSDLGHVARAYRQRLAEADVADFDEQIAAAIERLLADPAFRRRSQRFARLLLVDEFQDLTPAHLLLLRLLSGPAGAVFGVGDDDQTIYGYAGATPRWLVDFARYFPGSSEHSLEVNYRCPSAIVTAASNLLSRNALRVPKQIRSTPREDATEPSLSIRRGLDGPATRSTKRVRELLVAGVAAGDIAVLARVNASLTPVQVMLHQHGVTTSGGVDARFLQRGGVRGALAWMAVATSPEQRLPGAALREAARRPRRGLSASLLDLVAKQRDVAGLKSLASWLDGKANSREATRIRELTADVLAVRKAAEAGGATSSGGSSAAVLDAIRHEIGGGGLDASAMALDAWSRGAIASHGDDLDALSELAVLEPEASRFATWLHGALASRGGADDGSDETPGNRAPGSGAVTLASVHAVKGREWPHVVVHHATQGLLPHRLAVDAEEERRVFHVALTRASTAVTLVPGEPESSFLAELDAPGTPPVPRTARSIPSTSGSDVPRARTPVGNSRARPAAADGTPDVAFPAIPGARFRRSGHEHEIVALYDDGVVARLGDARATTRVAFGTPVTGESGSAVLAHPLALEASDALRAWRKACAKAIAKPAFLVLSDKTLSLLAATMPISEAALLRVTGIGPVKLEAYGDDLLALFGQIRSDYDSSGSGAPT